MHGDVDSGWHTDRRSDESTRLSDRNYLTRRRDQLVERILRSSREPDIPFALGLSTVSSVGKANGDGFGNALSSPVNMSMRPTAFPMKAVNHRYRPSVSARMTAGPSRLGGTGYYFIVPSVALSRPIFWPTNSQNQRPSSEA